MSDVAKSDDYATYAMIIKPGLLELQDAASAEFGQMLPRDGLFFILHFELNKEVEGKLRQDPSCPLFAMVAGCGLSIQM